MRVFRKLLALACTAVLMPHEAAAAPFNNATIRRIIDGREVFIDRRQASVDETAARGQELSTGSSRAEVLFDQRALGFLGNNSLIRLGEDCFRLDRGRVLVNGPQNTCLGTKVLGIRGTTYVLSVREDGTYELAVLSGEASVGDSVQESVAEDSRDILSMYPTLNPVIGLGSSAFASNASGVSLGEAEGLILGDASFFLPLTQSMGSNVLYSYTTASSNFDGAWGASTELGYKWFNPDNRSIHSLSLGYDGWDVQDCFHSQLALGGQWQQGRWQFGVSGGIPLDECINNLGYAIGSIGIPVADLGEQSITLSLSPYVLNGISESFGGGRIGLTIPIGNQISLSAYGQYDDLLDTVIGGQISYRFSTKGGFIHDPNLPGQALPSPLPLPKKASSFNSGDQTQIALHQSDANIPSSPPFGLTNLISDTDALVRIKAGEEAILSQDGELLSQQMMSEERFSQLILENMSGQNLLPESHMINLTYQELYGLPNQTLLSILGSDWRIEARTPSPRQRGANNLVVPNNKLPIQFSETHTEKHSEKKDSINKIPDYINKNPGDSISR